MDNLYDEDVIAWAEQQAHLLRTGQWSQLDIGNLAEEIDDVGKSEKRELQSRLCVLIAHARTSTFVETGLPDLPICMPWSIEMVLSQEFLPG